MKVYKIVIADDDLSSRTLLKHFIDLFPEYELVGDAQSGLEFIKLVQQADPDIVLVDINMPGLSGVEAIKECKKFKRLNPMQVIFTTGYSDFAVEAFDVSAIDYVIKPIERTRLLQALEKAKKMMDFEQNALNELPTSDYKVSFKSNNAMLYIQLKDILFFEKEARKTILHLKNERYEISESLKELSSRLPNIFFKTHKSYLVHLNKISSIEASGETYLAYFSQTNKKAFISKLKISEVQKYFTE
ncbi:LytR/AlgR family response regulator transcription factor [Sutcliffiella halmapala]|uniref:LytR/AlgR family response regulator transcription factor n=1 Tax=Sutcliffiella halmapala TaxID=79882 RepID=UPI0009952AD7|nr:LytTR family DNA-binding domain-containing protein [Sutcliffiella halmapala]